MHLCVLGVDLWMCVESTDVWVAVKSSVTNGSGAVMSGEWYCLYSLNSCLPTLPLLCFFFVLSTLSSCPRSLALSSSFLVRLVLFVPLLSCSIQCLHLPPLTSHPSIPLTPHSFIWTSSSSTPVQPDNLVLIDESAVQWPHDWVGVDVISWPKDGRVGGQTVEAAGSRLMAETFHSH